MTVAPDPSHQLPDGLAVARDGIRSLARLTQEAVNRATQALLEGDMESAQAVIDGDDAIDLMSIEVEEHCYRLLVLQNTMAGDLRQIVAAIWISAELERTADLATNICKGRRRIYGTTLYPRMRDLMLEISDEAQRLVRLAVESYVDGDAGLAAALHELDDRLDALHAKFVHAVIEAHRDGRIELQPAVQLALIGRFYERIGDHAVNIGDRVRYMVEGSLPTRQETDGPSPPS